MALPTSSNAPQNYPADDTPRVTLPKGSYPARLKGFYLQDNTQYKTEYHYQEIKPIWEVYAPEHVGEGERFTSYWDAFIELDLRPEFTKDDTTYRASVFVRRLNAALAMVGHAFGDGSQIEYVFGDTEPEVVGEFPVYKRITLKEKEELLEAKKAAGEKNPKLANAEEYKPTGQTQEIHKGFVKDILVDGIGTVGLWASLSLGLSADGKYNRLGSNDAKPLSSMELKALTAEGLIDQAAPPPATGKAQAPAGAPA